MTNGDRQLLICMRIVNLRALRSAYEEPLQAKAHVCGSGAEEMLGQTNQISYPLNKNIAVRRDSRFMVWTLSGR